MTTYDDFTDPKTKQERRDRRLRAEKERTVIRAQLKKLRDRLSQLKDGDAVSKQPLKPSSVLKKRPSGAYESGGESKRQKVEQERVRRVGVIWQQCMTILKGILKSKDSYAFSKPVNPVTAKCPDYFDIIKKPMDLGTIQKKFPGKSRFEKRECKEYGNVFEFRDDMRLVWANCRSYNAVGHPVRSMGDALSEMWEKKWALSGVEAKWHDEMRRQEEEDKELNGPSLASQIRQLDSALQHNVKAASEDGDALDEDQSGMNFERKRKLSIGLGQLPGDKVAEVMRIIIDDESMREKANSSGEVEVDIDALPIHVLTSLEVYVTNVLNAANSAKHQRKKKKAQTNGAAGMNSAKTSSQDTMTSSSDTSHGSANSDEEVISKTAEKSSPSKFQSEVGDKGSSNPTTNPNSTPAANMMIATKATTLISSTRPAPESPKIIKQLAPKKEVTLQNETAWAELGRSDSALDETLDDLTTAVAKGEDETDNLWDEFKSREQEEEQREREKAAEASAAAAGGGGVHESAARREAAQMRLEVEEESRKEKEESDRIFAAEEKSRADEKARELEKLKNAGLTEASESVAVTAMEMDNLASDEALTNVLGLERKESDSDSGGESDD